MNEIIRKRKSVRKYDMTKLDEATLDKVREQIKNVKALYPDIRFSIDIVEKATGLANVKAPHYLRFGSEEREGAYENIGFVGQQMDLFFSSMGLGSCWMGMGKPEEKDDGALPFVILMTFGKPAENPHRDDVGSRRKALNEISSGSDARLEAARLAPSARNQQGWYFIAADGKIHCYRYSKTSLLSLVANKLGYIDMGIVLWHIASETEGFSFGKEEAPDAPKGFQYMGTVWGR
jgi:nitroreductase